MRKFVVLAALVAAFAAPARAVDQGFSVGARLAFSLPMGDIAGTGTSGINASLSDSFTGTLPVWLDATYRFTPNISAGVYGQYAYGLAKNCPAGASCSGNNLRLGIEGFYNFMPDQKFAPYVGLGTGYEWLNMTLESGGSKVDAQFKGWEYANLQVGADYKTSPNFTVGPFAAFSIGQYGSGSATVTGQPEVSGDITDTKTHMWLQAGVKGTFNF